jgi:hypothetical protein
VAETKINASKGDSLLIQAYSTEAKILMQKAKFRVTAEAKSGKGSGSLGIAVIVSQ